MKKRVSLFLLIGDPVEGSLSPPIHNSAFKALRIPAVYVAMKIPPHRLASALKHIRSLGVRGFNVTIPHKVAIIDLLDKLDRSASLVEAVNTVVNRRGVLTGYNTDGDGALLALQERIGSVKGMRALVLGAGGAARAIVSSLVGHGCDVTVANRTLSRAEALASIIRQKLNKEIGVISLQKGELARELKRSNLLINATSVGMHPNTGRTLVTAGLMHPELTVMDIVYKPRKTRLLKEAEKAGCTTIDGLGMLVHQAALSFKIWTRRTPPLRVMRRAAEKTMEEFG